MVSRLRRDGPAAGIAANRREGVTSCVFAWEERAVESARFLRERIGLYVEKYPVKRNE